MTSYQDFNAGVIEVVGRCMVDTDNLDAMKDTGHLISFKNYMSSANPHGQVEILEHFGIFWITLLFYLVHIVILYEGI